MSMADVDEEYTEANVDKEYTEIRNELKAFLESPNMYAKADMFLTGNRYTYIFGCFGIRPHDNENLTGGGGFRRQASDKDRHAVEKRVITEMLNHMMIVPSGVLRIHVAPGHEPNRFLTPIKHGNLLWYRVPAYKKLLFQIGNLIDAHSELALKIQSGTRRLTEEKDMKMDISNDEAYEVDTVELDAEEIQLYTFTATADGTYEDAETVLKVLFSVGDLPESNWCNIELPITEDEMSDGPSTEQDVNTLRDMKLQALQEDFQKNYGQNDTCFFDVTFDDHTKCRFMLKGGLEYAQKTMRCLPEGGNVFQVAGTPLASMSLYVVSSEAVRVKLDDGVPWAVSVYTQTRIGSIRQSAAHVTTPHIITITRGGQTKFENISLCVKPPMHEGTTSAGDKRRLPERSDVKLLLRRLEIT
jgi:hypothetical protein